MEDDSSLGVRCRKQEDVCETLGQILEPTLRI